MKIRQIVEAIIDRTKENGLLFEVLHFTFDHLIEEGVSEEKIASAVMDALMDWDINWKIKRS